MAITLSALISMYSNLHNVPVPIVKAIIAKESGFAQNLPPTIEPNGTRSWGLMQINDVTAKDLLGPNADPSILRSTRENLYYGTKHLRYLVDRHAKVKDVISAWNAGSGGIGTNPKYTQEVYANYLRYSQEDGGSSEGSIFDILPIAIVGAIIPNLDLIGQKIQEKFREIMSKTNKGGTDANRNGK